MISNFDLGTAYAAFALFASFAALWVMQVTTKDADFSGPISILKTAHRFSLAVVSIVLFIAAMDTLYYNTDPRPVDFLVTFVLVMVLGLSALRHMAAPLVSNRQSMTPFTLRKS